MATGDESDEYLMLQVARGNRECLARLLRRHGDGLLTFIQRTMRNRHRGEELFQDVSLALWTHSRSYRYPRPFKTWLFGIAVKKCRADFRKQSFWNGREQCDPEPLASRLPTPMEAALQCETADIVASAVSLATPDQRIVLALRIWNGLSYGEIAAITGRSEATVRSHMFHALAAIRRRLEPHMR